MLKTHQKAATAMIIHKGTGEGGHTATHIDIEQTAVSEDNETDKLNDQPNTLNIHACTLRFLRIAMATPVPIMVMIAAR